jgi:purine-binding chemotaxis protein CheW
VLVAKETTISSPAAPWDGVAVAGKYMTFKLAQEQYGLRILSVREIIGNMETARVPRTREFIRGVINLRGKVIPVVDLRLQFGMSATEATEQTVIIVVQVELAAGPLTIGLLVDEVLEVLSIPAEQIEPPPSLGGAARGGQYQLGVGKTEKRVVFLLDIEKVLSGDELAEVARAAA